MHQDTAGCRLGAQVRAVDRCVAVHAALHCTSCGLVPEIEAAQIWAGGLALWTGSYL